LISYTHSLNISHLLFTLLKESIIENIDDVACITLPSAESNTESDINNSEMDPINSAIACAVEDGKFLDQKVIIVSNVNSTEFLPETCSIGCHEYELV
jgi:hypothetical protein